MIKQRGRKQIKAGEETVQVPMKMARSQKEKLTLLGGVKWVRARIDRARLKEEKDKP